MSETAGLGRLLDVVDLGLMKESVADGAAAVGILGHGAVLEKTDYYLPPRMDGVDHETTLKTDDDGSSAVRLQPVTDAPVPDLQPRLVTANLELLQWIPRVALGGANY